MSKTIEISRELLQHAMNSVQYLAMRADDIGESNVPVADALRTLLAAPVVEPAKCGICGQGAWACNEGGCSYLESGNGAPVVERQEPVGWVSFIGNGFIRVRCSAPPPLESPLYTSPPAPVAVVPDDIARDAVRYRWIRSQNIGHCEINRVLFETISDDCNPPYRSLKCEKDLDSAIDECIDYAKEPDQ